MTLVKICGITNLEDALNAVSAGADMLGFNFYARSPRYLSPDTAREIVAKLPRGVITIGVFVNEPTPDDVVRIASAAGLSGVQLHGDEPPAYCAAVRVNYLVKALAAGEDFRPEVLLDYDVDAFLLDAKHQTLRGGTGTVADWSRAKEATRMGKKIILAGGLTLSNVESAIRTVEPYAVDACSSLEKTPGVKDESLVQQFVELVHALKT